MNTQNTEFKILKLSDEFYRAYPEKRFKEILRKKERPYSCIVFELRNDSFLCIPFRSEIKHPYAYHLKNSKRSIENSSGLDYTKTVVVNNNSYFRKEQAVVDYDEYVEIINNINQIKFSAMSFVDDYIKHTVGTALLHASEYKRRYQFSPLKYFHNELGILP